MDRVTHPIPSHTHELLTAGGQSVTHDTQGNMLLIPASVRANSSPLVLTWDFDNRMVSADVEADSALVPKLTIGIINELTNIADVTARTELVMIWMQSSKSRCERFLP